LILDDAQFEIVEFEQPDRRHETQQVEEHTRTEPPQAHTATLLHATFTHNAP